MIATIWMLPIQPAVSGLADKQHGLFAILLKPILQGNLIGVEIQSNVGYPLLDLLGFAGGFALFWTLVGFLFGYFYPVIRGKDGFEKALTFATAVALPKLLLVMLGGQSFQPIDLSEVLLPFYLYLTLMGIFVFDLPTVKRIGFNWNALQMICGFNATLGYGSSLIVVGGLQFGLKYLLENLFAK